MNWSSAVRKQTQRAVAQAAPKIIPRAEIETENVDWERLVTLDFETYYDSDYTLSKLSTSEYVRDPRFKAQMVGIKIGRKKTKVVLHKNIAAELKKINWATHSVLCHNIQFDGFILSHRYGIVPARYYDTLGMARGLHSNEIGAGLDEVAKFYGGQGKIDGALEKTKGVLDWPKTMIAETSVYCANDVDETFRVFCEMHAKYPAKEMDLIHMTARMFCAPVLQVDIPRVQAEYEREIQRREELLLTLLDPRDYDDVLTGQDKKLEGKERDVRITKKVVGSNERFVQLFTDMGIAREALPRKISPAWMKKSAPEREEAIDSKWSFAFAKDDLEFLAMPEQVWSYFPDLDPNYDGHVLIAAAHSTKLQQLIDTRIAVKSTTNITRAERFLKAGAGGMPLPVGYAYYRAHTGRFGGNNKMNMQNLTRGGELRLSILAAKGHAIAVADSGQIEARVNGWLWGQNDLLDAFRHKRDVYSEFATAVYGRTITKNNETERHVGKVCLAEGELVLTHRGEVPINLISLEDRLWDGVEWVSHGGLIDQGIQEVITYDGLTATPDHEVFTECGRVLPLWQAASEMARLQRTGAGGKNLRFCDDHVVADTPRKRLSVRQGPMRPDWYYQADVAQQLEAREDNIVPQERAPADASCGSSGAALRRDLGAMRRPGAQVLGELRRAGDQAPVQDEDGVHTVGVDAPSAPGLQGCGDRQGRQQRALRPGEFAIGHTNGAEPEQAQHANDPLARAASPAPRVPEPLQQELDVSALSQRTDGRTDLRKVRVYDIADAGPRRRFTASGKLVFNCVLGLGYQMGALKLQLTLAKGALGGPPIAMSFDQCQHIVSTYRRAYYKIQQGWKMCSEIIEQMATGIDGEYKCLSWGDDNGVGYINLPNGMRLKYPDLRKAVGEKGWDEWSYQSGAIRKKIYGGLLCENLVQALARIIVMDQMLMIDKKYPVVMTTHDEVVAHPKLRAAQQCYDYMHQCMVTAPWWCPDIPLAAEGGWAANYSK